MFVKNLLCSILNIKLYYQWFRFAISEDREAVGMYYVHPYVRRIIIPDTRSIIAIYMSKVRIAVYRNLN